MAPHSSTLAWKIPWAEEPGGLQPMGSQRVGHDWATSLSLLCIGEGNGNPLQCSCLESPRDRGAWWAAVLGSHRVGHDWSDLAAVAATVLRRGRLLLITSEYRLDTHPQINSLKCIRYPTVHAAAAAMSLQSCPTLCDPIDGSPPGFPIPGILHRPPKIP